jgi:hypothetical protein
MTSSEIEEELKQIFEDNYETLRLQGGHALTAEVKEAAWTQIIYYFKKLQRRVAEKVTETEVKLTLPEQKTPGGRKFTIEGVVDIVTKNEETWMYDLKTHDPGYIRDNKELYEKQLNVYSHIYENIRSNKLDHTAIISTVLPAGMREGLRNKNEEMVQAEFTKWEPVISLDFDHTKVKETIQDFGKTVDKIESHIFEPALLAKLNSHVDGNVSYVRRFCNNCDARFSCDSYRSYVSKQTGSNRAEFKKYYAAFDSDSNQVDFITANLNLNIINDIIDKPE